MHRFSKKRRKKRRDQQEQLLGDADEYDGAGGWQANGADPPKQHAESWELCLCVMNCLLGLFFIGWFAYGNYLWFGKLKPSDGGCTIVYYTGFVYIVAQWSMFVLNMLWACFKNARRRSASQEPTETSQLTANPVRLTA